MAPKFSLWPMFPYVSGNISTIHMTRNMVRLPSGIRLHNYGKIHHFQWVNPLFYGHFQELCNKLPEGNGTFPQNMASKNIYDLIHKIWTENMTRNMTFQSLDQSLDQWPSVGSWRSPQWFCCAFVEPPRAAQSPAAAQLDPHSIEVHGGGALLSRYPIDDPNMIIWWNSRLIDVNST